MERMPKKAQEKQGVPSLRARLQEAIKDFIENEEGKSAPGPAAMGALATGAVIALSSPTGHEKHGVHHLPPLAKESPEQRPGLSEADFDLLAQNVYHEARGEPI